MARRIASNGYDVMLPHLYGNKAVARDVGALLGQRGWGTHHGFAFDDRPAYDSRADDRHWAALLDLFARNLAS